MREKPLREWGVSAEAVHAALCLGCDRTVRDRRLAAACRQVNLKSPVMMLRRKFGSWPPVGVVRETKSNTLPSFIP